MNTEENVSPQERVLRTIQKTLACQNPGFVHTYGLPAEQGGVRSTLQARREGVIDMIGMFLS